MAAEIYNSAGFDFLNLLAFLLGIIHLITWRLIPSAVMISPFILLIIAVRGKLSPGLRSNLLSVCFFALFLPFQRSAFYIFDGLYPFTKHVSDTMQIAGTAGAGKETIDIFEIISFVWLIGFVIFLIIRSFDYRKTVRMFREGKMKSCASYFYRFRSRIYLPPDFEFTYSQEEQEMLLAHERQHIKQHDPFIYRLLVIVECALWFNPLVSIAVRHFQHERELLCDEKVTQSCSKYNYGMLILKAAEAKPAVRAATAGIVMEHGSISERVTAMIKPFKTVGKKTAIVLICITAAQLAVGFYGFRPAWISYDEFSPELLEEMGWKELRVYEIESFEDFGNDPGEYIEGMEAFIFASKDGLSLDQEGMYNYAISLGLTDESCIEIDHVNSIRPNWGGGSVSTRSLAFTVKDLKTEDQTVNYTVNRDFFSILTDILI